MRSSKWMAVLFALFALSSCVDDDGRPEHEHEHDGDEHCERGGETYDVGDTIPTPGSEHTCVCLEGGEIGQCTGANTETCEYHGETYQVGDTFPSVDAGATSCMCLAGGVIGQCTGANDEDASVDDDAGTL